MIWSTNHHNYSNPVCLCSLKVSIVAAEATIFYIFTSPAAEENLWRIYDETIQGSLVFFNNGISPEWMYTLS